MDTLRDQIRRVPAIAALSLLMVALPSWAGMAELGRNGSDTANGGGKVKVRINPNFEVVLVGGESVDSILENLETQIDNHPQQAWVATHATGTNVLAVVRRNGSPINFTIDVEGSSFPLEAVENTGFDRVRVEGDGGIGSISVTDAPAGDGTVTLTVNGTVLGVPTSGHTAASLQIAIAVKLQQAGFTLCDCGGSGVRVLGITDITWEDTDSDIDKFGVGIASNRGGVYCNTEETGSPTACDASDSLTIQFRKPGQSGNLDGFDLYRKTLTVNPPSAFGPTLFSSPVITGATCLASSFGDLFDSTNCSMGDAGSPTACDKGDLVTVVESPVFVPGPKQVGFFNVAHSQVVGLGPAPADQARPVVTGFGVNGGAPRFFDPLCP